MDQGGWKKIEKKALQPVLVRRFSFPEEFPRTSPKIWEDKFLGKIFSEPDSSFPV